MSEIEPGDLFGGLAHAADERLLAVRRGRPVKELGALFPGGRLWHTILIVSYLELMVVEASGVAAWQPITGYLWLQLYVGLIPTIWRWMRPATQHQVDAERRIEKATLNAPRSKAAGDDDDPPGAELTDEERQRIEATPDAWEDELTPEPTKKPDTARTVFQIVIMPVLWIGAIVPLQLGLNIAVWGREHWQIALPAGAALAIAGWFAYRGLRKLYAPAPEEPAPEKSASEKPVAAKPAPKRRSAHKAVADAGLGEDVPGGGRLGLDPLAKLPDQDAEVG
jgi:hypothetical protein